MSNDTPSTPPQDLSASGITIPSDSEPYSSLSPPSSSPPQSSNNNGEGSPVVLYQPPTVWSILRGAAINLLLPFVNGMMLGFGELLAHEFAFRLGWSGTNVSSKILLNDFDPIFFEVPACKIRSCGSEQDLLHQTTVWILKGIRFRY